MRQLLFSITDKDCELQTFRSGGKGGQNQDKRNTGVRYIHRPSGAKGESREARTQYENRRIAFKRMGETKEFRAWVRREAALTTYRDNAIMRWVDQQMSPENIRIEYL